MKKLIFLIPFLFLAFFGVASADVVCTSPPSGIIYNSDVFNYHCTGLLDDLTGICNGEDCNYMQMQCGGSQGGYYTTPITPSINFLHAGTLGSLVSTGVNCYVGYSDTNAVGGDGMFSSANQYGEGASVAPLSGAYNVQNAPIPPNPALITLPTSARTDLVHMGGQIVLDIWELIALVIGVPLGFYILEKIVDWYNK